MSFQQKRNGDFFMAKHYSSFDSSLIPRHSVQYTHHTEGLETRLFQLYLASFPASCPEEQVIKLRLRREWDQV